ncbi:MAG: M1 family aminopeptidase [Terracidiphilus sp.]|jgi:hypothetical protein
MNFRVRLSFLAALLVATVCIYPLFAQRAPNANAYYQQLRGLLPGGEGVSVKDFVLKRDAAIFTFHSGSFAFYGQVNGKVTGAIFKGEGHLHITPPTAEERHNLSILAQSEEFDEDFDEVVLRFTDSTAEELHKASTGPCQPDATYAKATQELQNFLRHHAEGSFNEEGRSIYYRKLYGNLDLRLLEDVLSPAPGQYFFAAIHGSKDSHLYFIFDPQGIDEVAPEEVALLRWDATDEVETIPLAFHRAAEYANRTASGNEHNAAYKILHQDLDVSIEKNGFLSSLATVEVEAEQDGVTVIPLDLYPTLRVSQVTTDKGDALDWVQESKDLDPNFGVILAAPLKKGKTTTVKIAYGGKDVILNEGGQNYYPIGEARENWFPNSSQGLGDYVSYHMLFHVPKDLQIVATGTKLSEKSEGRITTSEWKTETPLPVVGFSLGEFATKETKIGTPLGGQLTIDAYANKERPDMFTALAQQLDAANVSLGSLDTTPMLANELSQGQVAAQIYTQYFGPLPFPHIALTQQSACDYGQSWPMLVYLPICGFLDKTQQHFLGLSDFSAATYWDVVTPHEVAHQWWGQTVGFRGYRDQWMSEGFAQTSASIFLQMTRPKPDDYLHFWKEQRELITQKNQFGFRPIDVGAVTMGVRLSSPKTGWSVYQSLVYPKGAYILHMIRMMMWTPQEGDARFKATMQDFVSTYSLRAATTEDFKAMVEKHMAPNMDLDGNHRMDWFFREYVYGTDLPAYHFEGDATPSGDGWNLHIKLTQSGVPPAFKMLVPIYIELADGKVIHLGSANITGDTTMEKSLQLPKLSAAIKKVSINYNYDVLCTDK